jgi:membrane glycosyltransferase
MINALRMSRGLVTQQRLLFGTVAAGFYFIGIALAIRVLAGDGWSWLDIPRLLLYGILSATLAWGCALALTGFAVLKRGRDVYALSRTAPLNATPGTPSPTAILVPIYNEDVARVFKGIRTMFESLRKTRGGEGFDFFILSDSSDTNVWIEEEKAWFELCKQTDGFGRIFYRRRRVRLHNKSGNVADFCRRWGAKYRYMVVLDADSVMTGPALQRLVTLMERNPRVGLIQMNPKPVLGRTLWQRIMQFAATLYGPLFLAGANFWQLHQGSFWGHNAIIRSRPFRAHCALPKLPRYGGLGGRIMSHDTVEAALLARAGYEVWTAYDFEGSYEELPPNVIESLKRDRRWCQGNLQHLLLLGAGGLKMASRIHILLGILGYCSAPLWLVMILLGVLKDRGENFGMSAPHSSAAWTLSLYIIFLLLLVKGLGLAFLLGIPDRAKSSGGTRKIVVSFLWETLFSFVLAPILMAFYTRFVISALLGGKISWGTQTRNTGDGLSWLQAIQAMTWPVLAGAVLLAWVWWVQPGVLLWMLPILIGLFGAVPFAKWTSSEKLGLGARELNWFLIPEETNVPAELSAIEALETPRVEPMLADVRYRGNAGLLQVILDPFVHAVHRSMVRARAWHRTQGERGRRVLERLLEQGPDSLSSEDKNRLLYDTDALEWLHRELWSRPTKQLAPWWARALRDYNQHVYSVERSELVA